MNDRAYLKAHGLKAPLLSMAKTWKPWMAGAKLVTRRGGPLPAWSASKPGSLVETCEWSPRVGLRWTCMACGWFGSRKLRASPRMELKAGDHEMLTAIRTLNHAWDCGCGTDADEVTMGETLKRVRYRPPRRGGLAVIVSTRVEDLHTPHSWPEAKAEGFPDMSWAEFCAFYCGAEDGPGFAKKWNDSLSWRITRLELAPLDLEGGETRTVRAGLFKDGDALKLIRELRRG